MNRQTKFGICAGVSLIALVSGGFSAIAQESQDNPAANADDDRVLDSVVVTGFRNSLAEALDVKRNASGVVDAIVAEDIAAFPDLNLAESLQRISGVSIDRVGGEGRQITVRDIRRTGGRLARRNCRPADCAAFRL